MHPITREITTGKVMPVWGKARFSVDFVKGSTETTMDIFDDESKAILGGVSETGSIISGTSAFSGTLKSTKSGFTGEYSGHFYGPQAKEFGYLFSLTNGGQSRAAGAVVGRLR